MRKKLLLLSVVVLLLSACGTGGDEAMPTLANLPESTVAEPDVPDMPPDPDTMVAPEEATDEVVVSPEGTGDDDPTAAPEMDPTPTRESEPMEPPSDEANGGNMDDPLSDPETTMFARVTGDESLTLSGEVVFRCDDPQLIEEDDETILLWGMQSLRLLDETGGGVVITFPVDVEPGTYDISTTDMLSMRDEAELMELSYQDTIEVLISVTDEADDPARQYTVITGGTLTLDAIPTGPDQPGQGSFEFTAETEDGANSITVEGAFDLLSIGRDVAAETGILLSDWYCGE